MSASPEQQLRAYVDYLRDMGIYDVYHRSDPKTLLPESLRESLAMAAQARSGAQKPAKPAAAPAPDAATTQSPPRPAFAPLPRSVAAAAATGVRASAPTAAPAAEFMPRPLPPEQSPPMPRPVSFDALAPLPAQTIPSSARAAALQAVRAQIGDCTRCPLAYAGRHTIVFADGDPNARLMFVGEGPGADEDASGVPFVGKAGQLLNNMIAAMGLKREQVYIANIVKCRPPGNRTPEFVEASTCSQFLVQQIDIVRPEIVVALGATAATYLLGVRQSLASLRGQWHTVRGSKLAVTYHPAFLLRDPRQKGEAWKDLQRVMAELKLAPPNKPL